MTVYGARAALTVHPHHRVGDVQGVVGIEGHVNARQPFAAAIDEGGQARHVPGRARNGQLGSGLVHEIHLGVDDEQFDAGAGHATPGLDAWGATKDTKGPGRCSRRLIPAGTGLRPPPQVAAPAPVR